jgi:phage tail-like protein
VTAPLVAAPLPVFRFHLDFKVDTLGKAEDGADRRIAGGAFSECTGLEATMEPKVIKEGGGNYGASQRVGPVTFATVILKRGLAPGSDLWKWFEMVNNQRAYAYRLAAVITVFDVSGTAQLAWRLEQALPIKFKAADLNARGTEVGVEELHLAHEGLSLVEPTVKRLSDVR